jgi:hypothetical protein
MGQASTTDLIGVRYVQTYAMKLKDREEYAEDDESLDNLQSFVMGTVAVRCHTCSLLPKISTVA